MKNKAAGILFILGLLTTTHATAQSSGKFMTVQCWTADWDGHPITLNKESVHIELIRQTARPGSTDRPNRFLTSFMIKNENGTVKYANHYVATLELSSGKKKVFHGAAKDPKDRFVLEVEWPSAIISVASSGGVILRSYDRLACNILN